MATPDESEPSPAVTPIEANVIEKADAGAQLYYALYFSDAEVVMSLPDPVVRAYHRAQVAFGRPRA